MLARVASFCGIRFVYFVTITVYHYLLYGDQSLQSCPALLPSSLPSNTLNLHPISVRGR